MAYSVCIIEFDNEETAAENKSLLAAACGIASVNRKCVIVPARSVEAAQDCLTAMGLQWSKDGVWIKVKQKSPSAEGEKKV